MHLLLLILWLSLRVQPLLPPLLLPLVVWRVPLLPCSEADAGALMIEALESRLLGNRVLALVMVSTHSKRPCCSLLIPMARADFLWSLAVLQIEGAASLNLKEMEK